MQEHWILGAPTAAAFALAHFVDFSLVWMNTVYWVAFGFIIWSLIGGGIVGFIQKKNSVKDLMRISFYHPWSVVIPVAITFVWIPFDSDLIRSVYIINLLSIAGCLAWIWAEFILGSIRKTEVQDSGK